MRGRIENNWVDVFISLIWGFNFGFALVGNKGADDGGGPAGTWLAPQSRR